MSSFLSMRFVWSCVPILGIAAACGGKTLGTAGSGSGDAGSYGRGPDGGDGGSNGYVDPTCADAGAPPVDQQCDVFTNAPCAPDEACYPVALPPQGKCQTETYGSFCEAAGTGTQGAPCDNTVGCAAGFVCLITGANTQCARMCDLSGSHDCPQGFVCEPIDVPGFSACL